MVVYLVYAYSDAAPEIFFNEVNALNRKLDLIAGWGNQLPYISTEKTKDEPNV